MKRLIMLLGLLATLSACLAPTIKPSGRQAVGIRAIAVIAVESPPLEVIPDLIQTRMPIYRQSEDVPYDLYLERKIYRNPGGVLVAGLVGHDDIISIAAPLRAMAPTENNLGSAVSPGQNWDPALVLAQAAVSRLTSGGVKAAVSGHYHRLPLAAGDRTANLVHWREAVRQWYNQDVSPIDYRSQGMGPVDAVLEVGLGTYRIFEGQAPLQALLKLVDPVTRKVIGRTSAAAFPVQGPAQTLLEHDAAEFKQLVAETGARLIARGLCELGLPPWDAVSDEAQDKNTLTTAETWIP